MQFKDVVGQTDIKHQLIQMVQQNRISHTQLLLGSEGCGNLGIALAFSQYVVCENKQENDSCGECSACLKAQKLVHPDIHFTYPVIRKHKSPTPSLSADYIEEWRKKITEEHTYFNSFDWLQSIDARNKQGNITVQECHAIIKKMNLRSYESPYKIVIIWIPEYLGIEGNTLLKMIEEPPEKTLFLFVANDQNKILSTILSRTQLTKIPSLKDEDIQNELINKFEIDADRAKQISYFANGNYNLALSILNDDAIDDQNSSPEYFLRVCRQNSFDLFVQWAEDIAKKGREQQKNFLMYTLHFFRELLILSVSNNPNPKLLGNDLDYALENKNSFDLDQISQATKAIEKAHYHIERNANPKILFLNLTIKMRKMLAKKKVTV